MRRCVHTTVQHMGNYTIGLFRVVSWPSHGHYTQHATYVLMTCAPVSAACPPPPALPASHPPTAAALVFPLPSYNGGRTSDKFLEFISQKLEEDKVGAAWGVGIHSSRLHGCG